MENKGIKNNKILMIIKKSEKLTTAVYLITDFFDERESLRWELRRNALSFLSFIESLFYHGEKNITRDDSQTRVQELMTLLELARNSFLISSMNFSIIKEEYQSLLEALRREREERESIRDFEFPERFFASSDAHYTGMGNIKDKNMQSGGIIKDTLKNSGFSSDKANVYNRNIAFYKKDIRRETIMKMIRAKGEITVKDISSLISGVSEKTLQRELLAMVEEGILAKEGERRWSRYLLKT